MGAVYRKLLDEWRAAAAATRAAQQTLNDKFDRFLRGDGSEPSKSEIAEVQALRDVENARLEASMDYVSRTASGQKSASVQKSARTQQRRAN